MALEEDVVLPTAHAQQDLAQQRDMMPVLGIDRDLRGGAERNLIGRQVVLDVDDSQRPAAFRPGADIHERSRRRDWPAAIASNTRRTLPLKTQPGTASKAASASSPAFTR